MPEDQETFTREQIWEIIAGKSKEQSMDENERRVRTMIGEVVDERLGAWASTFFAPAGENGDGDDDEAEDEGAPPPKAKSKGKGKESWLDSFLGTGKK